mgnify:CR=1 FL=1
MNRKNKVIIITSHFHPNVGGVETHLNDLVRALVKRNWKVIVSTYQPLAKNEKAYGLEKGRGYEVHRMGWIGFNLAHRLFKYPLLEFLYLVPGLFIQTLVVLLKNNDTKVVHAQGLAPAVTGLILARMFGKRAIVSTHNLYFFPKTGLYTKFSKFIFSSFDAVLTLSNASSKELIRIGVPETKIRPFRYWLDLKLFSRGNKVVIKKNLGLSNKFTALFVGRLIETKGTLLILEIARHLPNILFVIVGLGPLEQMVKNFAEKHSNLQYVGPLSQGLVRDYMNACDIVLVPSLVAEGYGRVAMEAIACGTPVLAARIGGLDEVVNNNVGQLVEPKAIYYEKALRDLVRNKNKLEKLKKNTHPYAVKKFSVSNVKMILSAYEK